MSTVKLNSDLPMGKETYYTIVDCAPGIGNNGRYFYVLVSYTNEGKPKSLSFSSSKPLQNGAYLKLYVSMLRGVTYWEEVSAAAVPVQAKQLTSKSRKKKIYNGRRAAPYESGSSPIYIIPSLSEPSVPKKYNHADRNDLLEYIH
ncbi:YxeA family protein [Paenibacillus lautus]|uniref:YxeA family protein n=1 Tax=Paenibacillus lautus TaxID=1401 RepID=UPI003D2C82E2